MKKMAALATVFFAGMYGDTAWEFIRQLAGRLNPGGGFAMNMERLSGVAGGSAIVCSILGGVGLFFTVLCWCFARTGDDDSQKSLPVVASAATGLLALTAIATGTYVMIPDVNPAREQQIRAGLEAMEAVAQKPKPPVYDIPVGATLTIGDSTITVAPDGGIKVVQAKSN